MKISLCRYSVSLAPMDPLIRTMVMDMSVPAIRNRDQSVLIVILQWVAFILVSSTMVAFPVGNMHPQLTFPE